MLDSFITDAENAWRNRNVVLQNDVEKIVNDEAWEQWENFKENGNEKYTSA